MTTWMEHMTFHVQYKMNLTNMAACHVTCGKVNFTHSTLGHVIEHGQVKGSHMTLNVQHESLFKLILRATMWHGRMTKPKSRLA